MQVRAFWDIGVRDATAILDCAVCRAQVRVLDDLRRHLGNRWQRIYNGSVEGLG